VLTLLTNPVSLTIQSHVELLRPLSKLLNMPPRNKKLSEAVNSSAKNVKSTPSPSKRAVKRKAAPASSDSGSDFEATPSKRPKITRTASSSPRKAKVDAVVDVANVEPPPPAPKVDWSVERPSFLPAALHFSYEDAKRHLISADPRFEAMFEKLPCRPFVQLERVEPFRYDQMPDCENINLTNHNRTLATSIMYVTVDRQRSTTITEFCRGQQISWKAARSVNWKFMRLFDETLPEVIPPPE